jgi:hypothetical protein
VLADPDVKRATGLIRESFRACPSTSTSGTWWSLLRSPHPDDAAAMARSHLASETDRLAGQIAARLLPFDPSTPLNAYFRARMANKDDEAAAVLQAAREQNIPLPFEKP